MWVSEFIIQYYCREKKRDSNDFFFWGDGGKELLKEPENAPRNGEKSGGREKKKTKREPRNVLMRGENLTYRERDRDLLPKGRSLRRRLRICVWGEEGDKRRKMGRSQKRGRGIKSGISNVKKQKRKQLVAFFNIKKSAWIIYIL